jgi:hypothetical protein
MCTRDFDDSVAKLREEKFKVWARNVGIIKEDA